jgi:hypothetical protein
MEVMKQTAVEWLRDLYENRPAYEECILEDEWEEALKMEKEQMIDAWSNGWLNDYQSDEDVKNSAEQYYNETFNTK